MNPFSLIKTMCTQHKESEHTKVGVGVLVIRDGKVLLGKRKGAHASGVYGSVGGHLEYLESIEQCARREAFEEAGIELGEIKFLCLTNFKDYAPKHYIDIGVVAQWKSGEPQVKEPDRCESWAWYEPNAIPEPLFVVMNNYFEAHQSGKNFFDN